MISLQQYSIVKLYKAKYNTNKWNVSKKGTPRLLVVSSNNYNDILKVKYPNGYIQKVTMDDIYPRTVFKRPYQYPKLLVEMPAARTQLEQSPAFAEYLKRNCPSALVELSQQIAARVRTEPRHFTPTPPAPTINLEHVSAELRAINDKLTTLIAIWGGPQYD